jgi:hypothetical protein
MACCFKNWVQKTTKPLLGKGFSVNRIGFEPMACCLEVFRHIFAILETQASSGFCISNIPKIDYEIQFCGQILWPKNAVHLIEIQSLIYIASVFWGEVTPNGFHVEGGSRRAFYLVKYPNSLKITRRFQKIGSN